MGNPYLGSYESQPLSAVPMVETAAEGHRKVEVEVRMPEPVRPKFFCFLFLQDLPIPWGSSATVPA